MQSTVLDDLIKETVYNSPIPLDLEHLMGQIEGADQREIVTRVMYLTGDGLIDTIVEDGITFFIS